MFFVYIYVLCFCPSSCFCVNIWFRVCVVDAFFVIVSVYVHVDICVDVYHHVHIDVYEKFMFICFVLVRNFWMFYHFVLSMCRSFP